jgi:hypothetical protein
MANLDEELFSEPRTVGANENTKDHTRTAAAPGELGQIVGYRAKKDCRTGYADLFHAPSITPKPDFCHAWLDRPCAYFAERPGAKKSEFRDGAGTANAKL